MASPRFTENDFRKSSRSEPDKSCVQVARQAGWMQLRDSKTTFGAPDDQRLVLTEPAGTAFLHATRTGRLDP